jgi:hypothetical protein
MVLGQQRKPQRGRKATSAALRWLAACVALLLVASSLGQIAHFLVVSHAICEEHGELVELGADAAHAPADHAPGEGEQTKGSSGAPEGADRHDHCEVLANAERQLALPAAALVAVVPAASSTSLELVPASSECPSRPLLALAPKTSPPRSSASA